MTSSAMILALASRAAAPGDEQRVVLYVGNNFEKFVGTVGECCLLLVAWHAASSFRLHAMLPKHRNRTCSSQVYVGHMVSRC